MEPSKPSILEYKNILNPVFTDFCVCSTSFAFSHNGANYFMISTADDGCLPFIERSGLLLQDLGHAPTDHDGSRVQSKYTLGFWTNKQFLRPCMDGPQLFV